MNKLAQRLIEIREKGLLYREATVGSVDIEARTVELSFSSEIEYRRWFGFEILDHAAGAIRLDRLNDKAAVLWNHNWDDMRGVVEPGTARVDQDRKGRAVVRFSKSDDGEQLLQDIADGIVTKVSVGYMVHGIKLQETRGDDDVYLVNDWEPYEISLVSVPADPTVGVGRSLEIPQEETPPTPTQNAIVNSGERTQNSISEEVRAMKEKILRDASGNLVRAMVDEAGKIAEVLEVLEQSGAETRAASQRTLAAEQARTAAILEMGDKFECPQLARDAVKAGKSADVFQGEVLEFINSRNANKGSKRDSKPLSESKDPSIGLTDAEARSYSLFKAVRAMMPNATNADREAAAFEFECSSAAQRQLGKEAKGILVPEDVLARAFNAGGAPNSPTGAQTGSGLVDTNFMAGSFIEMLRNRTTIMKLANTMGGLVGNVEVPKQTGGATAYWIGEGDDATEGTPFIGQLALSPKTVAAYVDITRRLMMQSTPDAEGIVRRDLLNAIAQAIDLAGYYGSGTANQPKGLKNYNGINAVTLGGAYPTYAEYVEMESKIAADNADVNSMAYVVNALTRGNAKTTTRFGTGTEAIIWEAGNTINGYRTEVTNQIAGNDVFFGNFNDLIVGLWGGLDLTVDTSSLSKSGGIRIVAFQDADIVLRREESFTYAT